MRCSDSRPRRTITLCLFEGGPNLGAAEEVPEAPDREEARMRSCVVAVALCCLAVGCSEAPTRPASMSAGAVAFARGAGGGAEFINVSEEGVDIPLPFIGTCTFRPDGSGQFNKLPPHEPQRYERLQGRGFQRTHHGHTVGGQTWSGTGHVNVNWPSCPTGDSFEATIVGSVSLGGRTAIATCKDRIAKGVQVEVFVRLH